MRKLLVVGEILTVITLLTVFDRCLLAMPVSINYQGRLREYGQMVSGTRTMNFKIYNSSTSAFPIWSSGDVVITVTSGTFNYALTPTGVDWRSDELWLETTISGKILSPREKLLAVPYALHSRTSEDLSKLNEPVTITIGSSSKLTINSSSVDVNMNRIVNISTPTAFDDAATKGYVEQWLPVGTILMWGGPSTNIPTGWLLCDGSAISRTTYARLFTAIGVTHGAGDGSTTFNLPNLTDRFIVGAGAGYSVAATGGEATHTLTISEMPSHNHGGTTTGGANLTHSHGITDPSHEHFGRSGTTNKSGGASGNAFTTIADITIGSPSPNNVPSGSATTGITINNSGTLSHDHTIPSQGSGAAHENRPPYYALCYIIKY